MSFDYPWVLISLLLPLLTTILLWNRTGSRSSALLAAGTLAALLFALAGPAIGVTRRLPPGIVFLVDCAGAGGARRSADASAMAAAFKARHGSAWTRVIPFAGGVASLGTLRSGLRFAAAAVPDGYSPRIVVMSDGDGALGNLPQGLAELQPLQVPVDVVSSFPGVPGLALAFVVMPQALRAGERFPVEIGIDAPALAGPANAQVMLDVEGGKRRTEMVTLKAGLNVIRLQQSTVSTGALALSGSVRGAQGLGEISFERAVQSSHEKVLYLSKMPGPGSGAMLRGLGSGGTAITRVATLPPDLPGVQLLILGADGLSLLTAAQKHEVTQFVARGGGLLFVGGDAQPFQPGTPDALADILPARPAPPEGTGDQCIVLLIDKSSSMRGAKLAMAREAVMALAGSLSPSDFLGVLAFDHGYKWIYPLQHPRHGQEMSQEIAGLAASGGTDIPPALSTAYRAVLLSRAKYRHLVLITDGISEEGDSVALAKEAGRQRITISTVALGNDVNHSFLKAVAEESGGRTYASATGSDLRRVTLKDVRDFSGSRSVEQPYRPVAAEESDSLGGVDVSTAPPLPRYSRYLARPGASTVLAIGKSGKDPLYLHWQYGLGHVGLFTSDALSAWASRWRSPAGFDRLWSNISRDLSAAPAASRAVAAAEADGRSFTVAYALVPEVAEAALRRPLPRIAVTGPGGFSKTFDLEAVTPTSYGLQVDAGGRTGLFKIVPEPASVAFPATAVRLRGEDAASPAASRAALKQVAEQTGGRVYAGKPAVWASPARAVHSRVELWGWLVGCAIVMNFAGLAVRRAQNRL